VVIPDQIGRRHTGLGCAPPPFAVVVCCSDCCPTPETIFDQPPGSIITVQNIGPLATDGVVASVEGAVALDGVSLVVVLAHDDCPLIGRLCSSDRSEVPLALLGLYDRVRAVVEAARSSEPAAFDPVGPLALDNAFNQARTLLTRSQTLQDALDAGRVTLQIALFASATGEVTLRPITVSHPRPA
jgi:carbonic anhydrase